MSNEANQASANSGDSSGGGNGAGAWNQSMPLPDGTGTRSAASETLALYGLLREVILDKSLDAADKKALIDELRKSTPSADRWTSRIAIWILGLVVVLTIIALWQLSAGTGAIPDSLVAIGSAAVGGLAGLLTANRGRE